MKILPSMCVFDLDEHVLLILPEVSAMMWGMLCSSRGSSSRAEIFRLKGDMLPTALDEFPGPDFFITYHQNITNTYTIVFFPLNCTTTQSTPGAVTLKAKQFSYNIFRPV